MDEHIKLKGITRIFGKKTKTVVLKGIDLVFPQGEFAGIIGQSGSGKSTLLNIISTLDRPTEGELYVAGEDLTRMGGRQLAVFRNRTLGFIFQFHYLLPEFNALENVLIPHWIATGKQPPPETVDLAKEMIRRVGMEKRTYQRITELSGGEQQRIAIARSLINRPQIILADEPTGSLDSKTSVEVNRLLREINEEFNTTFLIVTHDRHIAAECDRVVELVDGLIERDYHPEEETYQEKWKELAPTYCLHYGDEEFVKKLS